MVLHKKVAYFLLLETWN